MGLIDVSDANRIHGIFLLAHLRHQLYAAIESEDYIAAASVRDRIQQVEKEKLNQLQESGDTDGENLQDDEPIGGNQ